jgi:DNA-binding transcriptional MerR regulator
VADRAHVSIGEVLALLREEFPDVTISKIRFLESQGLLDPERTPSGYRKFYEADVERLRWILRQQRENFLPLKVIRGRLSEAGPARAGQPRSDEPRADQPRIDQPRAATATEERPARQGGTASAGSHVPGNVPTRPKGPPARPSLFSGGDQSPLSAGPSGVNLTMEELANACGLPAERIKELERYGLLASRTVGGTAYYDEDALVVAHVAAAFARHGVEARHLRMYKNSAERESGLLEQVVMPLIKQRNPQARQQALQALDELSGLGQELRQALLRQALRSSL